MKKRSKTEQTAAEGRHFLHVACNECNIDFKNPPLFIAFAGGEFSHRYKNVTALTPFAHFFDDVKNRWEALNFWISTKMSKPRESESDFTEFRNRCVKNLLFFNDFIFHFGPNFRKSEQTAWE